MIRNKRCDEAHARRMREHMAQFPRDIKYNWPEDQDAHDEHYNPHFATRSIDPKTGRDVDRWTGKYIDPYTGKELTIWEWLSDWMWSK